MMSYDEIELEYIRISPTTRQTLQFIRTTEDEPWRKMSTYTPDEVYELIHDARDHRPILVIPGSNTAYKFSQPNSTLTDIAAVMWPGADYIFMEEPGYECFHDVMELPISRVPLLQGRIIRLRTPAKAE